MSGLFAIKNTAQVECVANRIKYTQGAVLFLYFTTDCRIIQQPNHARTLLAA